MCILKGGVVCSRRGSCYIHSHILLDSLTNFCFASLVYSYLLTVFVNSWIWLLCLCEYVFNTLIKAFGTLVYIYIYIKVYIQYFFVPMLCGLVLVVKCYAFSLSTSLLCPCWILYPWCNYFGFCIGWVLDMQMILCIELIILHVRMFISCVNEHCGHYL